MSKDMAKQAHYEQLSPQPIDVIRAWKLGFHLGNVIKYVGRCTTKGQELEDLEKAKVYLQWRIDELRAETKPVTIEKAELKIDWDKVVESMKKDRPSLLPTKQPSWQPVSPWVDIYFK